MRAIVIVCLGLGACGRFRFDAGVDSGADPAEPRCSWANGPTFGSVIHRDDLSSPASESAVALVPGDPLTMVFSSARDGTDDMFVAHRPATDAPWDQITKLGLSTTTANEIAVVLDRDGLHGYLSANPSGNYDLFEVARASTGAELAIVRRLDELVDGSRHFNPWPASDGLSLSFTVNEPIADSWLMYTATRSDLTAPWSQVQPSPLNMPGVNVAATFSADHLLVVWEATSEVGTDYDLYYAVRDRADEPFGARRRIEIATREDELIPGLREDGCELYFSRGPASNWDLFSVEITP